MRSKFALYLIGAAFFFIVSSVSYAGEVSMGIKAGTLGIGPEVCYHINRLFSVRVDGGYLSVNKSTTSSNIKYNLNAKLKNAGLLLDWHPFFGSFRVSAGIFYDGNKLSGDASSTVGNAYTINGHTYVLNKLSAKATYKKAAPYFGIGWDTSSTSISGLGFVFDAGFIYSKATVDLTAYGSPAIINNPQFQADLAKAQSDLQSDINKFKFWPVVMLGLVYRF